MSFKIRCRSCGKKARWWARSCRWRVGAYCQKCKRDVEKAYEWEPIQGAKKKES